MTNSTIDKLIQLSEIFKQSFTVEVKNGDISQYTNISKPYIVSYHTILEIHNNNKTFKQTVLYDVNNYIVGGWLDKETNTFYIELNKAFHNKRLALIFGKQHKQKHIYDLNKQEIIKVWTLNYGHVKIKRQQLTI